MKQWYGNTAARSIRSAICSRPIRIGKLGPSDRAIVLLWLENLSYEEIGQIVGITPKNVSVRLVRIKSSVPVIAGFAGLALIPFLKEVGFSVWFLTVTGLLLLTAMGLTMYVKRFIPRVDGNLVSAAEDVARFRKINTDWIKNRRDILRASDDLLSQIGELRQE